MIDESSNGKQQTNVRRNVIAATLLVAAVAASLAAPQHAYASRSQNVGQKNQATNNQQGVVNAGLNANVNANIGEVCAISVNC